MRERERVDERGKEGEKMRERERRCERVTKEGIFSLEVLCQR